MSAAYWYDEPGDAPDDGYTPVRPARGTGWGAPDTLVHTWEVQ